MYMSNLIVAGARCESPLCNTTISNRYDYRVSAPSKIETGTEWFYYNKSTLMDEIYDEISLVNGTRPSSKFRLLSLYTNAFFKYYYFSGYCGLTPEGNTVNNFASIIGYFKSNNMTTRN